MRKYGWFVLLMVSAVLLTAAISIHSDAADEPAQREWVDWGSDHVGQTFPEYVTGDECLFCHRTKIGPSWNDNPHQKMLRRALPDDPAVKAPGTEDSQAVGAAEYLLGSRRLTRFLRKSKEYGKLDLLTTLFRADGGTVHENTTHGTLEGTEEAHWDPAAFADRCAGCHATAVDTETGSFAAISLDCFTCHGDVDLAHTNAPGQIFLSESNRDSRKVISTCGQCHLRGGQSRSSGRPYPNTFIPGDNLFRDFDVDLSGEAIDALSATQQHIYENSRAVVTGDETTVTCLSCHSVHDQSSKKHQQLEKSNVCNSCHDANMDLIEALQPPNLLENHNQTCDY